MRLMLLCARKINYWRRKNLTNEDDEGISLISQKTYASKCTKDPPKIGQLRNFTSIFHPENGEFFG